MSGQGTPGNNQVDALRAQLALKGGGATGPSGATGATGATGPVGATGAGGIVPGSRITGTPIYLDPVNRTGLASNVNTGLGPLAPILSWNHGVLPHFGGITNPTYAGDLTFIFLSGSPTDGSDPIVFDPTVTGFSLLQFKGTLDAHNLIGSGILAGVVAKDRPTGTVLQANLSGVPGAAVGQVLVNTTIGKESQCHLIQDLGGGVFKLDQPFNQSPDWPITADPVFEVDTYANGDAYSLYLQDLIDFVELKPIMADWNIPSHHVYCSINNLGVLNPSGGSNRNALYVGDGVAFLYCTFYKRMILERPFGGIQATLFYTCFGTLGMRGQTPDVQSPGVTIVMFGGAWQSVDCSNGQFDYDIIFLSSATRVIGGLIGAACVDTGAAIQLAMETTLAPDNMIGALWGHGSLNVTFGRLLIQGDTAVNMLLLTGGLTINGQTTAFTATRANPSVLNGTVPVTPTNVDANPSGLFQPGGGSIANFT